MKNKFLIITVIILGLAVTAKAEYQSGYNPNEEYNCHYSMGSEKFLYTEDGISVPFEQKDWNMSNGYKKIRKVFADTTFNFKFAANGDLIRVILGGDNPIKEVIFHNVIENNKHLITAHYLEEKENIFLSTVIFKNSENINSIENLHIDETEDGIRKHFSLSWYGNCERVGK